LLWNFWYFGQTLMDNHKLVMVSISYFLKYDKKNVILFFLENMHETLLEFDHIHETKIHIFCIFEMRNCLGIVFRFFETLERTECF